MLHFRETVLAKIAYKTYFLKIIKLTFLQQLKTELIMAIVYFIYKTKETHFLRSQLDQL
jgi:hypothetical protein